MSSIHNTTLFTENDLMALRNRYYTKKNSLSKDLLVDYAVDFWYSLCMERHSEILQGLYNEIEKWESLYAQDLQWSHAFTFLSFNGDLFPSARVMKFKSMPHCFESRGFKMSMWSIYRHTDFCAKLLKRLGLDAKRFCFKNIATVTDVDGIMENSVHLVYRG